MNFDLHQKQSTSCNLWGTCTYQIWGWSKLPFLRYCVYTVFTIWLLFTPNDLIWAPTSVGSVYSIWATHPLSMVMIHKYTRTHTHTHTHTRHHHRIDSFGLRQGIKNLSIDIHYWRTRDLPKLIQSWTLHSDNSCKYFGKAIPHVSQDHLPPNLKYCCQKLV